MGEAKARRKIPPQIVPQAEHVAGSTIIQQLGLDTSVGLQRILQLLMFKFDPEAKGFFVDIPDMQHAIDKMVDEGRSIWLVKGESDRVFFKMCTQEEHNALTEHEEGKAPGVQ